jgi:phosphoadenosine phosphosulfate reductase
MTGIRRDQTPFRRQAPIVSFDNKYGLVKINPLANWSSRDVFRYLVKNQVPYNPLHDQGYPSIGCVPCTQKVMAGEGERAGRWAGQEKIECGLHL